MLIIGIPGLVSLVGEGAVAGPGIELAVSGCTRLDVSRSVLWRGLPGTVNRSFGSSHSTLGTLHTHGPMFGLHMQSASLSSHTSWPYGGVTHVVGFECPLFRRNHLAFTDLAHFMAL